MANLNQCNFIGRLGKDPEQKALSNGDAVCNFSIAVSERWKDKTTGQQQERTTWVNIVAFKRLAEIISQYCSKGSKVFISGKLQTRKWQDQSGQDRYTTEIVANEMQMLDSRGDGNLGGNLGGHMSGGNFDSQGQGSSSFASQNSQNMSSNDPDFDDDVPF